MAYDDTLSFDTSMNSDGFQKVADSLGNTVKGLGVFEIMKKLSSLLPGLSIKLSPDMIH